MVRIEAPVAFLVLVVDTPDVCKLPIFITQNVPADRLTM
jgi:hypothetical protein